MPALSRVLVLIVSAAFLTGAAGAANANGPPHRLSFQIVEGANLNSFVRQGPVAAHLVLRSGVDPRLLVAFPAGNSGVGLWFEHLNAEAQWKITGEPKPVTLADGKGRPLYGVTADVTVNAPALTVKQAILSNIRVLRDYQIAGTLPAAVVTRAVAKNRTLAWSRDRLDGAAGYLIRIDVTGGTLEDGRIVAGSDGKIRFALTAASGDAPLMSLAENTLLDNKAAADPAARKVLEFLSYREKFLAGSWRFDTYFGRDTLMSIRLLMPVLRPAAIEDGLRSVFSRLSAEGDVAHEEDISEFAVLEHMRADGTKSDAPLFNYNMIDETAMLAPVTAAWLLDDARGASHAAVFLAGADARYGAPPESLGADLVRNLRRVAEEAAPFAADPRPANLIALKPGQKAGNWRDSDDGLGGGRYPYDVDAVLVPVALEAASRFYASGLLDPYMNAGDRKILSRAGAMAAVWRSKAPPLFDVHISRDEARHAIAAYASALKVPGSSALRSLPEDGVFFHALSLDAGGKPLSVLNSDEGTMLLFSEPDAATLERTVTSAMRPFPAGLMTDAGMMVADPAFAAPGVQVRFGRNAYHGTVVWSWQQAQFAAGLARQLARSDLPAHARAALRDAQKTLWHAIEATRRLSNSELWSWAYKGGRYRPVPFGARSADADESDAAQLWSTVYLAIPEPDGFSGK